MAPEHAAAGGPTHSAHDGGSGEGDRRRSLGFGLLIAGLALVVVGLALLAGDDDDAQPAGGADLTSTSTTTSLNASDLSSPSTPPTSGATTTTVAVPTTTDSTADVDMPLDKFVELLATALETNDTETLLTRLHPAVLEQYSEQECRNVLGDVTDGFDLELVAIGTTGPWTWEVPDGSVDIPVATAVTVARTVGGERVESESHFAHVDGEWHWFTYCGPAPG